MYSVGFRSAVISEASLQMLRPQYGCSPCSVCSLPPKLPHVLLIGGTCETYGFGRSRCRETMPASDPNGPDSSLAREANCCVFLVFLLQSFGGQRCFSPSTTSSRYEPP